MTLLMMILQWSDDEERWNNIQNINTINLTICLMARYGKGYWYHASI